MGVIERKLHHGAHVRVGAPVDLAGALLQERGQGSCLLRVQVVRTRVIGIVRRVVIVAVERLGIQAFDEGDVVRDGQRAVEVVPLFLPVAGIIAVRGHHRVLVLEELGVIVRKLLAVVGGEPRVGGRGVGPTLLVHRPDRGHRLVRLVRVAAQGEGGAETVRDARVHVRAEVVPVIVQGSALVGAFLVHVADVEEVVDLPVASVHGQVVLALGHVVPEQFVGPVSALLLARAVVHDLLPGVLGRGAEPVVVVQVAVQVLLVDEHHMRGGVGRLRHIQEVLPTVVRGKVDVELAALLRGGAVARGHEDDAVRGPHAVDGGGGVLQHGHGLDFIGIHAGEVALVARNAVHHEQRRTHAADVDGVVERTRLRRALGDAETGHLTGQHVDDVLVLGDDHFLVGHGGDGTRQGRLLLDAVTHDHRFFQEVRIVLEDDHERRGRGGNHLIGVADEGDHEIVPRGSGNLEPSGRVGHRAPGCSLHDDAGADERLPALVLDRSPHGTVLGLDGQRQERRQHGQDDM